MIGAGVTLYEALKAADQLAAQVTGVKDLLLSLKFLFFYFTILLLLKILNFFLFKIWNFFLSPFYFYLQFGIFYLTTGILL